MIFFKSGVDIGIELHEYSYCVLSAPPPPTPLKVINHNHLSNCFTRAKKRLPREISMPTYLHSSLFYLVINTSLQLQQENQFFDHQLLDKRARTTDTQRGNSLHCTAENSIPIPNFQVWWQHILSATSAKIFRYL